MAIQLKTARKNMITKLSITEIIPGTNDRSIFDEQALKGLADNIQAHGLIQPITVRPMPELDCYQIVAGERRFRAVQLLGWADIPAVIIEADDQTAAAIMLAENVARKDLDPIDEAKAYSSRMILYGWSVDDCATKAGVSIVHIQFRLKLLTLRADLQELVRTGNLQLGYAQILSDARLEPDFQTIAVRYLRDNPRPTPAWFRTIADELATKQNQQEISFAPVEQPDISGLFAPSIGPSCDGLPPMFGGPLQTPKVNPPSPATDAPPSMRGTALEILEAHRKYWQDAAADWAYLGRNFKAQECTAAAQALTYTMLAIA